MRPTKSPTDSAFILSACGVRMPRILYGTAWKQERTATLVSAAISVGFRGIDTACQPKHYDEAGVGAGIVLCKHLVPQRGDLYLQTKFTPASGQDPQRMPYDPNAAPAEQVTQSMQASLRNLQTHYLDCLLLHSPIKDEIRAHQVWQAMEALVEAGSVLQLGISNCYRLEELAALYAWTRIKPAVLQNRFYADTGYDRDIREFCRKHSIVYQSFWTLTANPHLLTHPTLLRIAATHARTPAQVLFRMLSHEGIVPLTGTQDATHMQQDLAIFEFELNERERRAINELLI